MNPSGEAMGLDERACTLSYAKGQQDMLAKCIAAVEALTYGTGMGWLSGEWISRDGTITALRALQEKR